MAFAHAHQPGPPEHPRDQRKQKQRQELNRLNHHFCTASCVVSTGARETRRSDRAYAAGMTLTRRKDRVRCRYSTGPHVGHSKKSHRSRGWRPPRTDRRNIRGFVHAGHKSDWDGRSGAVVNVVVGSDLFMTRTVGRHLRLSLSASRHTDVRGTAPRRVSERHRPSPCSRSTRRRTPSLVQRSPMSPRIFR